ncbi:MAG TPA: HD domain-containing protein [Rectinemataceae bacterium]|nr:HD domain-containing protein [Rectinemataceae bacterium]
MKSGALLEHLASSFTEPVRDPLWGNIFLSPGLEALANSGPFAKLARIKQLGPAHLVYPGATHTRRAHSLGVFHMARRLCQALVARGGIEFVTREGLDSFLAAALCHDLGHFPFAHSLKELPLADHEALTARLLVEEPLRSLVGTSGADPEATAAIVDQDLPDRGDREIRFFRGLLSGVLDPDKLDYLTRDAFFCGVPYGIQDSDFILQRVGIAEEDRLGIEERGLMSVESLLFSKYLMYRSVYWHKGVRAATSMIKKAVLLALGEAILAPEDLYGLDDDSFYASLRAIKFAPFALAEAVFEGRLYPVVLDLPFDEGDERHRGLLDLGARLRLEGEIAERASVGRTRLSPLDIVVDLPEPVSFETDLCVIMDRGRPGNGAGSSLGFAQSPTVFSPPVVAGFARALRRVRVFCADSQAAVGKAAHELLGGGQARGVVAVSSGKA